MSDTTNTTQNLTADQLAAQARIAAHMAQVEANKARTDVPAARYTETRSPVFGQGRRYDSQRGATQYDTGSGRYSVQIWDED